MARRTASTIAAFLALSAASRSAFVPGVPQPTPAPTVSRQTRAAIPRAPVAVTPAISTATRSPITELLCGYFHKEIAAGESHWACVPDPTQIEFLIASVPDPEATHLSLYTDRFVESLTWAVNDSDFIFHSYYVPWKTQPEKELATFVDRQRQEQTTKERRAEPGILLFQDKNARHGSRLLLLFLVPETPTAGIDLAVLGRTKALLDNPAIDTKTVRFVGPVFSGSMIPLARYLTTAFPVGLWAGRQVRVVSGSATDLGAYSSAQALLQKNIKILFTTESDERALDLFHSYVDRRWRNGEIAFLSEDETLYGTLKFESKDDHLLALRYPRDIARLRNVYPENPAAVDAKARAETADQNKFSLKNAGEAENPFVPSDGPPTFSAKESPASQQAALLGVASTLRREHARYAGITATDVMDSLFLISFLRQATPDVRLFTTASDLLYLRESENISLNGLLTITTYPLFSRNQHWTHAQLTGGMPRRVQFTSRDTEGVYNAARFLMAPPQGDSKPLGEGETLLEYSRPRGKQDGRPPVWLTVVGRDGYWPVGLLDDPPDGKASHVLPYPTGPGQESFLPEMPSFAWMFLFVLLAASSVVHCWYLRDKGPNFGEAKPNRLDTLVSKVFVAYPRNRKLANPEIAFLLGITLASLCAMWVLTSSLAVFGLAAVRAAWVFLFLLLGAPVSILLLLCSVRLTCRMDWRELGNYKRIVAPTWALALIVIVCWSSFIFEGRNEAGYFAAYRSLHLTNGVTPALPLLLAAASLSAWAWMQLKRHEMLRRRSNLRSPLGGFEKYEKQIDDSIEDIFSARVWLPALLALVLFLMLQLPFSTLRSIENKRYDVAVGFSLGATWWLIALCWMQFMYIWTKFRAYLEAMERHPVRAAFSRFEKQGNWVPLVTQPPRHQLLITGRMWDSLRKLVSVEFPADTAWMLKNVRSACHWGDLARDFAALEKQSADEVSIESYTSFHHNMSCVEGAIRWNLCATAWRDGDSESLRSQINEFGDKDAPLTAMQQATILGEEIIALRHLIYMRYVFRHLRNLLGFVMTGFVISVIAVNSYPFQGTHWLAMTSGVSFLVLGVGIARVFAQMDRDALISRITETKANRLDKTFYVRLVQFGGLPLLTVLSTQFPSVNKIFFAWLQPALEALR